MPDQSVRIRSSESEADRKGPAESVVGSPEGARPRVAGRGDALVNLLGEPRATVVRILKRDGEHSAPELAERLEITDVAVRRHLGLLADEGLLTERTVKQPRGRPVTRYGLADRAEGLFPHRYADLVDELLDFITAAQGRAGLRSFLRWRQEREAAAYAERVNADELGDRLEQLTDALEAAGYEASVTPTEDGWQLTQTHCAVFEVAKDHPELCVHEAAAFRRVLGRDVRVSRRETLAQGDRACVCTISSADCGGQDLSAAGEGPATGQLPRYGDS